MKYKIELKLHSGWAHSWALNQAYTKAEAAALVAKHSNPMYVFRVVPLVKPYRRHAAVTPLELRGAYAMLESAISYLTYGTNNAAASYRDACTVLVQAKRAVRSQLLGAI